MQELHNPLRVLQQYFGYDSFKFNQLEIIQSILSGNDTLAILPTGGGKSICYQIPALLQEGTTIVVSPLISLMKDQVDALTQRNIPATFINSTLNETELKSRLKGLISANYKLLYIAPERLESRMFLDSLTQSNISFVAIDEAHCISEWGHDFRPSYRIIYKLFEYIPRRTISAFTATATPEVRTDIIKSLGMKSPKVFVGGFERPNISISVTYPNNRTKSIVEVLQQFKEDSVIIYVGKRNSTLELSDFLNSKGLKAVPYHGAMENEQRNDIQEKFINGEANIIVATNAFGMGIDKPDVRCVIHSYLPLTLEAYYQEIGRAGRDGKPSKALFIYSPEDENLANFFLSNLFPNSNDIKKLFNFINLSIQKDNTNFIKGDYLTFARYLNISQSNLNVLFKYLERKNIIKFYDNSYILEITLTELNSAVNDILRYLDSERRKVYYKILDIAEQSKSLTITVDIKELINQLQTTHEQILTELNSLQNNSLIQINKKLTLSGIKVIATNLGESLIIETIDEMTRRREQHTKKYLTLLEFLKTTKCKSQFILEYFGETNPKICGICDSCHHSLDKNIFLNEFKVKYIPHSQPNDREYKLYMKINQLFTTVQSFEEFVEKMEMSSPEIANICQTGVEMGYISIKPNFIESEIYKEVVNILNKKPAARLSEIRLKMKSEINYPLLRIYVAFARQNFVKF